MPCELRDVCPGLWLWRVEYPDWRPRPDWGPVVSSTCVASGGEVALLDPLAPPEDATEIWERFDARPPTIVVVLKPDHVRDTDLFVRRYGARAFGPYLVLRTREPTQTPARYLTFAERAMHLGKQLGIVDDDGNLHTILVAEEGLR